MDHHYAIEKLISVDSGSAFGGIDEALQIAISLGPSCPISDCILASSASHLRQFGRLEDNLVLEQKCKALVALQQAIAAESSLMRVDTNTPGDRTQMLELNFGVSVMLLGTTITEGASFDETMILVNGIVQLLQEHFDHKRHNMSEMSMCLLNCLAYCDILMNIPCPSRSSLDYRDCLSAFRWDIGTNMSMIDPYMGCLKEVFLIIADASALLHDYYTETIELKTQSQARKCFCRFSVFGIVLIRHINMIFPILTGQRRSLRRSPCVRDRIVYIAGIWRQVGHRALR